MTLLKSRTTSAIIPFPKLLIYISSFLTVLKKKIYKYSIFFIWDQAVYNFEHVNSLLHQIKMAA